MSTYNSSVNYYRVNANNTNIAITNSGVGSPPTEEIAAPLTAGTYSSGSGVNITGQTPGSDFTQWSAGQYLYFIDNNGVYRLLGQINTIGPAANVLTLVANAITYSPAIAVGMPLAASYSLVTTTESFYIRVQTQLSGGGLSAGEANIPLMTSWRTQNTAAAPNNTSLTKLERVSNVGTPVSNASAANIPFTLRVMNVFSSNTLGNQLWPNQDFPEYIWIRADLSPTGASLAGQSMFRITTEETINAFKITANTTPQQAFDAGYVNINLQLVGGTTGTPGGGVGGGA
jgi:hypothetical protein